MIFISGCSKEDAVINDDKSNSLEIATQETVNNTFVLVYISGEVNKPGVYKIDKDSRVDELVKKAGGFTEYADMNSINLARKCKDGEHIIVNKVGSQTVNTKININTADENMLMTIKGIGKSKANDIINYRKKHGNFQSIEELKNIKGIKDTFIDKIKDSIVVE